MDPFKVIGSKLPPLLKYWFRLFSDYSILGTCQQADNVDTEKYTSQIINVLQDIMEIITQDVMSNGHE